MINEKIDHFAFWTPVAFTESTILGKPDAGLPLTDFLFRLGSWADQYAYLGQETLVVEGKRINASQIEYELNEITQIPHRTTALKASSYVLSVFFLPAIAFIAKIIFKIYLNSCMVKVSPNTVFAEKQIGKTKIVLLSGSLMAETTDAIVNAANQRLVKGLGVCGAVRKFAGESVFNECKAILKKQGRTSVKEGEAVLTSAGNLTPQIKVIAHAVGPVFRKKATNNADLLAQAYTNSLKLVAAPQNNPKFISSKVDPKPMRSIAFPSLSTGIFGYPLQEAPTVAFKAVSDFINANPDALDEVRFVFLPLDKDDQKTATFYHKALLGLDNPPKP